VTFHQLGDPRAFIPTFGEDPSAAVATAIEELTAAADENARVRRWKRGLALVALVPPGRRGLRCPRAGVWKMIECAG
jgi:hypothetical protein